MHSARSFLSRLPVEVVVSISAKMSPVARQLQSHIEKKSLDLKSLDAEGVAGALRVSVADVVRAQLELLEQGAGANETRGKSSERYRQV